jgi:cytoskeletal protein RodZ
MLSVHHTPKQHRTKGAVSVTTLIIGLVVVGISFVLLKFFFEGAKETSVTVKDRNQKFVEQKKVLINDQTERLKTMRESQETP